MALSEAPIERSPQALRIARLFKRPRLRRTLVVALDGIIITLCLVYTTLPAEPAFTPIQHSNPFTYPFELLAQALGSDAFLTILLGTALWLTALALGGMYARPRPVALSTAPTKVATTGLTAVGLFSLAHWLLPEIVPIFPPLGAGLIIPALLIEREVWAGAMQYSPRCFERTLLLAPKSESALLRQHIARYAQHLGLDIVGTMSWDDWLPRPLTNLTASFDEITQAMDDCEAESLTVSSTSLTNLADLQNLRWLLEQTGRHLNILAEPSSLSSQTMITRSAPGLMLLETNANTDSPLESVLRRAFDIVASSVLIVLLLPLWFILIVWIRVSDRGPAFFLQTRVGKYGRPFKMMKFRTMVTNAEALLPQLQKQISIPEGAVEGGDSDDPDTGVLFKLEEDPRITRVGRFLRRTSLDELPQLFNVWMGHMSLVGPRPPLFSEVERYSPKVMRKFTVRPGITGLWQVSGRSDLSWRESVRLDLHYIEHRSLRMDLWILAKTVKVVFDRDGAY
ncbi:sugar transferase [Schaalia sp. Marseille-Q2122]|uniref:sugar transferase n=1 Tax=Schaalia sp. Marseille-Q2122 TaxID=2736604 RepID=UPI00158D914B|nr:sugar transferase [Schaalia sp. Marseille-Q2122]